MSSARGSAQKGASFDRNLPIANPPGIISHVHAKSSGGKKRYRLESSDLVRLRYSLNNGSCHTIFRTKGGQMTANSPLFYTEDTVYTDNSNNIGIVEKTWHDVSSSVHGIEGKGY
ncbi:hypothetical protein V1521DRAFT_426010 [Lipomyces starkeyi]